MERGYMSEEEQNRLLAKAIIDYSQSAKELERWRARARELAEGTRAVSVRISSSLEGKRRIGGSPEAYPTKEDVDQVLKNIEDAEGRVKRLAAEVRRMGGAPDLSIADSLG